MQIMQAQIGQLTFEMQAVQGQLFEWSQPKFDVPVPANASSGITSTQPPAGSIIPVATTAETSVSCRSHTAETSVSCRSHTAETGVSCRSHTAETSVSCRSHTAETSVSCRSHTAETSVSCRSHTAELEGRNQESELQEQAGASPWHFLCPVECAKLSTCSRRCWNYPAEFTPLSEWAEEWEQEVLSINAEIDEHEDDVEEQWQDQEFSAEELEEVYQMATSTCPENPEQAFSEMLEHRRSQRREGYGWP